MFEFKKKLRQIQQDIQKRSESKLKRKNIFVIVISLFLCASLLVVSAATISEIANNETNGDEQLPVFLDVKETDWFYDDVRYVQENKLMTGTSETEFSPSGATTRGMIVTILWRVEGEPVVEGKDFDDVGSDAWYSKAVAWASNNQIVSGYSETTFGPNDTATREQLATIMYRYASYKKCDLSKKAKLDKYEDREDISYYAVESIEWANANGIISGTSETTISPKDNVLRSQVAAILRRFCENFKIIDNSVVDEKENAEEIADDKKEESKEEKEEDNDFGGGGFIGAGGGPDEPIIPEEEIPEEDKIVETQRPAINIKTAYGDPGEYITVLVDIEDNPGILGMILQIEYDENAMTLVGAENGEAIENVLTLTTSKELNSGAKFVWDGLEITPSQIEDGTVLKLEFRLSDDAIYGKRYPLTLKYTSGDIIDSNFASINPLINQGFVEINQEDY